MSEIELPENTIGIKGCFNNTGNTFAVLNKKQFVKLLKQFYKNGIVYKKCNLNKFEVCVDEHLIPANLFYKGNSSWFYEYYIFYKAKKMFNILYPHANNINNLVFYYNKERPNPLIIVNNNRDIQITLVLAPQEYVADDL